MGLMRAARRAWRNLNDSGGSQIAEFAVCVPLLTIFAVGIYDFSGAFTLKQKLASAAQEGALVAAAQSTYDLPAPIVPIIPPPPSVQAIEKAIFLDLQDQNVLPGAVLNTVGCGTSPTVTQTNLKWIYQTYNCNASALPLTITIDRGSISPLVGATGEKIICSHVTVSYPYLWQFQNVISLVGGASALPMVLTVDAYAANQS